MKIEIGITEGGKSILPDIKHVITQVANAVPGLSKHLKTAEGLTAKDALVVLAAQISEILVSHSNLEVAITKLDIHAMRLEATIGILQEEYKDLSKQYDTTTGILDRVIMDLTAPPDDHEELFDNAVENMKEYVYDADNVGSDVMLTFKERDLRRALADAMHGFNIKVINS
jgi:hypothetical protein